MTTRNKLIPTRAARHRSRDPVGNSVAAAPRNRLVRNSSPRFTDTKADCPLRRAIPALHPGIAALLLLIGFGFCESALPGWSAQQVVAGGTHSCALLKNGLVKCWGENIYGQLGLGDTRDRGANPTDMGKDLPFVDLGKNGSGNPLKAVELAVGAEHTCARLENGEVKCWGFNNHGQLGLGDQANRGDNEGEMGSSLPAVSLTDESGNPLKALELDAGNAHTCARLENGDTKCWGRALSGRLGLGDEIDRGTSTGQMGASLPRVELGDNRTAVQLSASYSRTCARLDDGSVKCWGRNLTRGDDLRPAGSPDEPPYNEYENGQLGLGDTFNRGGIPIVIEEEVLDMGDTLPRVELGTGRTVVELSTGPSAHHACAALDNGEVKCWGSNVYGQLGLGDNINNRGDNLSEMGNALNAVALGAGRTAVQLATGEFYTCALLDDGSVKCWGRNDSGQLGLGNKTDSLVPANLVDLGPGLKAVELAAGFRHICARLEDGSVKCWGSNSHGQLGLGLGDTDNRGDGPDEMGAALPAVDLGGPKIEVTDPDASDSAVDSGTFTVTLDAPALQDLVIPYTVGGTAKPGQDYEALSGSVTIPKGQTSAAITVTPLADTWIEGEGGAETVIITLGDIAFGSATLNIADAPLPFPYTLDQHNDPALPSGEWKASQGPIGQEFIPADSFLDVVQLYLNDQTNGDGVGISAFIRIRQGTIDGPIVGTSNSVFFLDPGPDSFSPLFLSEFTFVHALPLTPGRVYVIEVVNTSEGDIGIFGSGFGVDGYPAGRSYFEGKLFESEGAPFDLWFRTGVRSETPDFLTISTSVLATVPNAVEKKRIPGEFTIRLDQTPPAATTIVYSVAGTATEGEDYDPLPGTVLIPAGATSASIPLSVKNDRSKEGPESVVLTLRSATAPGTDFRLATPFQATITIADDEHPDPLPGACKVKQLEAAAQLYRDFAVCQRSNLTTDAEADYLTCHAAAKTSFAERFDTITAYEADCNLTLAGTEVAETWGALLDTVIDPLLDGWAITPVERFREAARLRRFITVSKVVERSTKNALLKAEVPYVQDNNQTKRRQKRADVSANLSHKVQNLQSGRPDYTGPGAKPFKSWVNDAVDGIANQVSTPTLIKPLQLAVGDGFSCARFNNLKVKCWGANTAGQLGLGDKTARGDQADEMSNSLPFVDLGTGRLALELAVGGRHVCARLNGGFVKCWGDNGFGQLGLGDTLERGDQVGQMGDDLALLDLGTGRSAVEIRAGDLHTCARLDDGSTKCWGGNSSGQLGLGDTTSRGSAPSQMGDALPAVDLGSGLQALELGVGFTHTCARLNNGSVKCWGQNLEGALGLGDAQDRGDQPDEMGAALPAVDLGGLSVSELGAGGHFTCARSDAGRVACWGSNAYGQLGAGDSDSRGDRPGAMGSALPLLDLGSGRTAEGLSLGFGHACATLDDGSLKCWGLNDTGQLGLGDIGSRGDQPNEMGGALPPIDLGTGRIAVQVTAGRSHTCARLDDGSAKCWGSNTAGALGLGDTIERGSLPGQMGDNLPALELGTAP